MDYLLQMKETAALVESALDEYIPVRSNAQQTIYEAMRYSLLGGGKRIRGVLTVISCLLAGGSAQDALPCAAAVEMVHAYSLIHDDLPAMDNDDSRRGKPTCHIAYGEAMAILAGDALLGCAFETVLTHTPPSMAARAWEALRLLAQGAGTEGMLGGQVVDMQSENTQISYDQLVYLHSHKTGALIEASCLMGSVMGGGGKRSVLQSYARKLGLAFQIQDDILDVEGSSELLGKPVHSDENSSKSTFVSLCGMDKAKEMVDTLSEEAAGLVRGAGAYGDFLAWLALSLARRNK